jgi:branched-chain amino acid aminotransferase
MALTFPLATAVPASSPETIAQALVDPGFGVYFSDHMAQATWTADVGWHDDAIDAYRPFQIAPGDAVFHYAQEIFEGLKAYRHDDGSIWLFRPEQNAQRLNRSARRMALPTLPEEDFLTSVRGVVRADAAWVPSNVEQTLYVRPFMFAAESFLGVRAARTVTYAVIAGPAGPYFASGVKPVDIWVTTTYSRAGEGGTGAAKCGGNYASSLIAGQEAYDHGCSQVLFTDAASHEWIEELGGMNVFFVTSDRRLLTPPTSGTILEGITRDSVLQLAPEFGLKVQIRPISFTELVAAIRSRDIVEAFACGTAAVVTPIARFRHNLDDAEEDVVLGQPAGEMATALRQRLVDLQWGRVPDPYGWMTRVL